MLLETAGILYRVIPLIDRYKEMKGGDKKEATDGEQPWKGAQHPHAAAAHSLEGVQESEGHIHSPMNHAGSGADATCSHGDV